MNKQMKMKLFIELNDFFINNSSGFIDIKMEPYFAHPNEYKNPDQKAR